MKKTNKVKSKDKDKATHISFEPMTPAQDYDYDYSHVEGPHKAFNPFEKSPLELSTTAKNLLDGWAKECLNRERHWFRKEVEKFYLEAMLKYINEELDK